MTDVAISGDAAIGGSGGDGGGIYVDASSAVALDAIIRSGNQSDGGAGGLAGPGGTAGDDGAGIGGGAYPAGPDSTEQGTRILGNTASTSNNDLYGQFGSG
jgi:hypothetical protein